MRRKVKKQKRPTDQSVRRLRLAVRSVAPYNFQTAHDAVAGVRTEQEGVYGLVAHLGLRDGDGGSRAALRRAGPAL